ncbi:SWIB-domain-containing protein [Sistotremastrum niveocremeum HHB9708]|uniref:SWIB-domain-containing protein n=2 Tax=Sistotremastraceae TaxID=3402574 RepID=A0A164P342_9AGAM|nr:SWIB-domain-containing protein [Sistotremastrum niveocremeum HHB9708]KZT32495.1 SWIB-domain-containing protein [Sistotremastrum suecicum HHB10207 ss-3]
MSASMSIESLGPKIRAILTAPDVDLSTISAKRVRRQILETDPSADEKWLRAHKSEVDALIASVFESVNALAAANGPEASQTTNGSSQERAAKEEDDTRSISQYADGEMSSQPAASPKKASKPSASATSQAGMTDEEYARQLSAELNGRVRTPRSTTSSARRKANGKQTGRRQKKSQAEVESSGDEGGEGGTPKKKKRGGGGGGFQKDFHLSEPLANLLDMPICSRPQVVKKLWEHIKSNELQNPNNKREILCDEGMKKIFSVEKLDMFQMNKLLGNHLYEITE